MLTSERLRRILSYDPDTGEWCWLQAAFSNLNGEVAGTISVHGYRIITIDSQKYRAARLAILYMTGEWPSEEVDHINRVKTDDRWENLRVVSRSENALNRDLQSNNESGIRNIHWNNDRKQWYVQIKRQGVNTFIGRYDSLDEATAARDNFLKKDDVA